MIASQCSSGDQAATYSFFGILLVVYQNDDGGCSERGACKRELCCLGHVVILVKEVER